MYAVGFACVCVRCICRGGGACACVKGVSSKNVFWGDCWSRSHICLFCVCYFGGGLIMCVRCIWCISLVRQECGMFSFR